MGKKLLAIFVSLVLMLSCVGVVTIGAAESNIVKIGVFSDTHNHADGIANVLNNIYELSNNGADLDGVVMNGDIVYLRSGETPAASHYETLLANTKYQELKAAGKLVYSMGNHEFPLKSASDATLTSQAIAMFKEQTGFDQNSDTVLGGYHFITAGPSNYDNIMYDYEEYMMDRIDAALAEDPEKPVFLIAHQPIAGTVRNGDTSNENKYSADFKEYLDNQPRVIVMTGHTHQAESDPLSIRQEIGGCTYVQTGHITGGSNYTDLDATVSHSKKVSQAIMLEINSDTNVVTFKRFYVDAAGAQYLEAEDWVIDIPAMMAAKATATESDDLAAYKYTMARENLSVAPVFAAGSTVTTSDVAATSVQISFPAANQGDSSENSLIKYYEISVYDLDSAQFIRTDRILSDFFLKESERRSAFTYPVTGLTQGTSYRIDVCASTPYFKKSAPISSTEFITLKEESFESVTLDPNNTFTVLSNDCVATPDTYKRENYIQVPNGASTHKYKFTFTLTEPGMYRFMTSQVASVGAPTTMVIAKEDGTVLKTGERYIATGGVTTYEEDVPYADVVITTPGTYTATWSRGNTGDTVTLRGLKVGWFDVLPAEYLDEYVIEKNASESADTSGTVDGESITLNKDGYVTWQVSPDYTGTFNLTYDQSAAGTTTVTSEGVAISGDIAALPVDASTDSGIELQLIKGVTYNFTFKATEATTVTGLNLVWQENFTDLENDAYKFTYNVDTSLAYGNIDAASSTTSSPAYFEKNITVPYDANYTFSINAGLASTGDVHAYIERVSGGTVSVAGTGSVDTIANRILFENVPLKAGTSYKVTLFNGKSSSTIKIRDLVFETSGAYLADIDNLTFLGSDWSTISSGLNAALYKQKHCQCLLDDKDLTYKLKLGVGNYKVYAYTKANAGSDLTVNMSVDGALVKGTTKSSWGSSVTKQELGTIRVSDDEFTLKIAIANTSATSRILFYRFEIVAIDEPVVTMHSGTTADDTNVITTLGTETAITAKVFLPKEVNGKNVAMLLAIYKGDVLYKVGAYEVTGKKNTIAAVTLDELELEAGENYSTKVFLLNGLNTLAPLYSLPAGGMIQTAVAE